MQKERASILFAALFLFGLHRNGLIVSQHANHMIARIHMQDFTGGSLPLVRKKIQSRATNLVEGHAWLTMAIDNGRGNDLVSWKRRLEARMTPAQIAEANQLVQQ